MGIFEFIGIVLMLITLTVLLYRLFCEIIIDIFKFLKETKSKFGILLHLVFIFALCFTLLTWTIVVLKVICTLFISI